MGVFDDRLLLVCADSREPHWRCLSELRIKITAPMAKSSAVLGSGTGVRR